MYIPLSCTPEEEKCTLTLLDAEEQKVSDRDPSCDRELLFGECIIKQRVVRKICLWNPTALIVPFSITLSDTLGNTCPYFTVTSVGLSKESAKGSSKESKESKEGLIEGSIAARSSVVIEVEFHPLDTYDSYDKTLQNGTYESAMNQKISISNNCLYLPLTSLSFPSHFPFISTATLTIELMYGFKESFHLTCKGRTQEFLFNARLLGSLNFGSLFLGTKTTKILQLQNNRTSSSGSSGNSVDYTLCTDDIHDSMYIDIVEQDYIKVGTTLFLSSNPLLPYPQHTFGHYIFHPAFLITYFDLFIL